MKGHLAKCFALGASAAALLLAPISGPRGAANTAQAGPPSAQELADRGLSTAAGLEDEGSYRLIDPIGPGGTTSVVATSEVLASTLQGGKYTAWRPYRDPFDPNPPLGPGTAPYHTPKPEALQ